MKLLMTADRVGGVWQYATDLARALAPLGVETVVAVLGPASTGSGAELLRSDTLDSVQAELVEALPFPFEGKKDSPLRLAGTAGRSGQASTSSG